MVEYQCKKCSQYFNRKFLYDQHCNRKTNCNNNGSKSSKKKINKCNKCNRIFSRKDSLNRHASVCKINIINKASIIGGKKITAINGQDIISVQGNKNIALNKNNIHINLMLFGKDGIKNISIKDLASILKSDKNMIESIISNVNLNPNKPQHHNILYTDIKSSYGEVYEDKKWVKKKIDETINTLVDSKIEDLNEILNDMNDFLNKKSRIKIKDAIQSVDYSKPGARKKLISYLKPILYNNKEMIIKTRKLTKEQEEEFFKKEQERAEAEEETLNRQYAEKHKNHKETNKNLNDKSDDESDSDIDDSDEE